MLDKLIEDCVLNPSISKEEMKKLLYLADGEAERERLKYAVVKSSGLSGTKAKTYYGFETSEAWKIKLLMLQMKLMLSKIALRKLLLSRKNHLLLQRDKMYIKII